MRIYVTPFLFCLLAALTSSAYADTWVQSGVGVQPFGRLYLSYFDSDAVLQDSAQVPGVSGVSLNLVAWFDVFRFLQLGVGVEQLLSRDPLPAIPAGFSITDLYGAVSLHLRIRDLQPFLAYRFGASLLSGDAQYLGLASVTEANAGFGVSAGVKYPILEWDVLDLDAIVFAEYAWSTSDVIDFAAAMRTYHGYERVTIAVAAQLGFRRD